MYKLVRAGVVVALMAAAAACQAQAAVTAAPTAVPLATRAPTPKPTATPAATAAPIATSSPTTDAASPAAWPGAAGHLFPSDVGRSLEPGRYVGVPFAEPFTFEVPGGFSFEAIREGNVAVSGQHGYLGAFVVEAVFPDPCKVAGEPVEVHGDEATLEALRGLEGFRAGDVTESTIDGRRARSFELANAIDTSAADCTRDLMLPLFRSIGNPNGEETNGGTHQVVWVIDGAPKEHLAPEWEGPVVVVADSFATDADLAVLTEIVASFDFE